MSQPTSGESDDIRDDGEPAPAPWAEEQPDTPSVCEGGVRTRRRSQPGVADKVGALQEGLDAVVARVTSLEHTVHAQLSAHARRLACVEADLEALRGAGEQQAAGLEALGQQAGNLAAESDGLARRLRDDRHRVENAADHALRSTAGLEATNKEVSAIREGFRQELAAMAGTVKDLSAEVASARASQEELRAARAHRASPPRDVSSSPGKPPLDDRLKGVVAQQKQLLQAQQDLQKEVRNISTRKETADALARQVMEVHKRQLQVEKHVTEQLDSAKRIRARKQMYMWSKKWDPCRKVQSCQMVISAWTEHVLRRRCLRDALRKTSGAVAKAHVNIHMRALQHATLKDTHERVFQRLGDMERNHGLQLQVLSQGLTRLEGAQEKQVQSLGECRSEIDEKLREADDRKADKAAVEDMIGAIDKRLTSKADLDSLRRAQDGLQAAVCDLQATKLDAEQGESLRRRLSMLDDDVAKNFKQRDQALRTKAEITEMEQKADARAVEEAMLLLVRQTDQLTHCLATDVEQVRESMMKFLELSPDVRKSALVMGFHQNEQCLACRPPPPATSALEPVPGLDNTCYKVAPHTPRSTSEQVQQILDERLNFPASMVSRQVKRSRPSGLSKPPGLHAAPDVLPVADSEESPRVLRGNGPGLPAERRQGSLVATGRGRCETSGGKWQRPNSAYSYFPASAKARAATCRTERTH